MFVRTAMVRDLEVVRALLIETWHDTYDAIYGAERVTEITESWHSIRALSARLERPGSEFLVADDGREIAGMAFAVEENGVVLLQQLYVRPHFQGRGVGGLLFDEIESCFPDAGLVRIEVDAANARAIAFYVALGFVEKGSTENCADPASGIPALIFEKPIICVD